MTIKRLVTAIALALLMGIVLPVATAQAPPCFTFDGQIKTIQCPVSFRPEPVQYYSNAQDFVQATDDNDDDLPRGFFDQQTINTLRENAAQNQTVTNNATATAGPNQNQTAPPGSNLTTADIAPVRFSLNTTRQALENNDTQAAIESINRADGALFALILEEDKGPVRDQLTTLSNDIETIRESVFNLDNEKALADLNAADAQLVVITEMFPIPTPTTTEEEEPEPEPQTFPFGYPEEEQEMIREDNSNQNQTNTTADVNALTIPFPPPPVVPQLRSEAQPESQPPTLGEEPTIKVPLNRTLNEKEIITIREVGGINRTTHETTTTTQVPGNKTTHREVTTTEVPL
jgi:hypothetical protein